MAEQLSIHVMAQGAREALAEITRIQAMTQKQYQLEIASKSTAELQKTWDVLSGIDRGCKSAQESAAAMRQEWANVGKVSKSAADSAKAMQDAWSRSSHQIQAEAEKTAAAVERAAIKKAEAEEKAAARIAAAQAQTNTRNFWSLYDERMGINRTPLQASEYFKAYQNNPAGQNITSVSGSAYWDAYNERMGIGRTPLPASEYFKNIQAEVAAEQELAAAKADLTKAQDAYAASTKKASIASSELVKNISKFATWYVVGNIFSSIVRNFREAISAMKDVDTQLTNIQKVSGKTTEEIKKLGDAAYETASKYGVAASEYLEAVYTFEKAGLGDSAEKLGELATKTMLVGDTTSEVATKFLVATNAAWDLKGSYTELSKAVDTADFLNNNWAVTLSDIAEALPIVASTAAQAGMTMEETMAAIGTIVSKTAQTGRRSGTALRAIIMNLIGETGELEDGITVTTESINSLNGVLNVYAHDAMEAAKATGTIVDPMTAIAALAKASEEGVLNQKELFDLLSGLGGKLRTNQLTALVNGTEMYNDMLVRVAGSAGTADSEIETMLTSWESKTQILKNTWTDFVQKTIQTDFAKSLLDIATALVKFHGSLGNVLPMIAVLIVRLKLSSAILKQKEIATLANVAAAKAHEVATMESATAEDRDASAAAKDAAAHENLKLARMQSAAALSGWAALIVAVVSIGVMAWQNYERAQEEARQKAVEAAEATQSQVDALKKLKKEYTDIMDSTDDESERNRQLSTWKTTLIEQYGFEYDALRNVNKERQNGIDLLNEEIAKQSDAWIAEEKNATAYQEATKKMTEAFSFSWNEGLPSDEDISGVSAFGISLSKTGGFGEVTQYNWTIEAENASAAIKKMESALAGLHEKQSKGIELTRIERESLAFLEKAYENAKNIVNTYNAVFTKGNQLLAERIFAENANRAAHVNSVATFEAYVTGLRREAGENEALADALENLANEAFPQFVQANIDATSALFDAEGQLTDTGKAALDADSKFASLARQIANTRAEAAQTSYANLISELNKTGDAALTNAAKLALFKTYFEDATGRTMSATEERYYRNNPDAQKTSAKTLLERLQSEAQSINDYIPKGTNPTTTDKDNTKDKGKDGETPAEKALKDAKALVDKRKAELELLEAQNASVDERAQQMRYIGDALNKQLAAEKNLNGESADSIRLKKEILENENAITELYKKQKEEQIEKNKKTREERLERRKQDVEILQSELSVMEAQGQSPDRLIEQHRKIIDALREQQAFTNDIVEENRIEKQILDEEAAIEKILTDLQKERVDELQKAVDLVLEREQAARDAEIASIDKQLDKLEKSRDIKQDQLDLEEKILAVQEAQAALDEAQAERTVRYYNSLTGQWEWGANASTVKSAQDALKNAQDALNEYYDDQAYNSAVARLNKRKDKANKRYSSTEDYWNGIMSVASTWGGGVTNAAIVKVNADGTAPSGLSYGTQVVTGGGTYAIVPPGTAGSTYNAKTGYSSILIDKNKTTANTTFDSGGVLRGIGGIKATYRDEAVLPPDLTKAMLSPGADSVFATRLAEMRYLYGVDGAMKNCRVGARSTNDHYGNNYSIGGVTISEADAKSMTVYQLAQKARTLAIRNARQ